MEDDEILKKCLEFLHSNRSIKVDWFIPFKLNIPYNIDLVKRIRIRILESNQYKETDEVGIDGFKRIVFNPEYRKPTIKDKYPILFEIIKVIILLSLGYAFRVITEPKYNQVKNKISTEQFQGKLDSTH